MMRCPICKRPVDEKEADRKGSFYPFCSERCKLIDLGRWLGGKYQISFTDPDEFRPPEVKRNQPEDHE